MASGARRAVVLGGTGAIGFAVARRLLASGWTVDLTGRQRAHLPPGLGGASFSPVGRDDLQGLRTLVGGGAELLVDCVCYTAAQARALLPLLGSVGATVMISSKAVYVDAAGRHSNSREGPRFDGPVTEAQPTVAPGDVPFDTAEGYGANKVAAEQVLLDSGLAVTVLRPSKVHGAWARRPREWVFVRRALEGRRPLILARLGAGVDHPSAAVNVAALVERVAGLPGQRIVNSADPDTPNARDIARTVADRLGHRFEEVLLDGPAQGPIGRHPWDTVPGFVLDMSAAAALGYAPVGSYAATVAEEIDWLVRLVREGQPSWALPAADDAFFAPLFDYAAEDRYLASEPRPAP
jgi:nucleoside-diphosphate-sugar epimerase